MKINKLCSVLALTVALTIGLTACSSTEIVRGAQPLDWQRNTSKDIHFNAARVQVIRDYQDHDGAPYIDHLMNQSPADAIESWANGTLQANGTDGYVQVRIKDASVMTRDLGKLGGVEGYFTKQYDEQLVANIAVEITGDLRSARFNGYTSINASKVVSVPEDVTPEARKAIEQKLVNDLITDFSIKADQGIRQHLSQMILPY